MGIITAQHFACRRSDKISNKGQVRFHSHGIERQSVLWAVRFAGVDSSPVVVDSKPVVVVELAADSRPVEVAGLAAADSKPVEVVEAAVGSNVLGIAD